MSEVEERYRTFWPRFWAGFIDGLLFLPIAFLDFFLFDEALGTFVILVWGVVSYSSYWVYSVLLHARFGATIGKMTMGVQVLDLSESRIPSLKQAFIRESPHIVARVVALALLVVLVVSGDYTASAREEGLAGSIIAIAGTVWFILELVTMFMNDKRRALHDLLAGTVVVRRQA